MSQIKDVYDFHEKFGLLPELTGSGLKAPLQGEIAEFRWNFLCEELKEMATALNENSLFDQVDALIDIAYVAIGTLVYLGLSKVEAEAAWKEVQRANMSKMRTPSADQSKRGSAYDIIKPDDWSPPNYDFILQNHETGE